MEGPKSGTANLETAESIIKEFGGNKPYVGSDSLARAIELEVAHPECSHNISEEIYEIVAREQGADPKNVKKNIRTRIQSFWIIDGPDKSSGEKAWLKYIGLEQKEPPKSLEFIEQVAGHLIREKENQHDTKD